MDIKNIYLIGIGAVGCAVGCRLHDLYKENFKIIADEDRIKRYKKDGFIINDKRYDFNYVTPEDNGEKADLIIVCVKYHHLEKTISDMKNYVGENTIILSLLNGISSEEIIGKVYGMDKMLYSMIAVIDAVRVSNRITFSNAGIISFGEKDNTFSDKVKAVKAVFDAAKVPNDVPQNIMKTIWWKYMVNIGINQASAVLKAPYGVFQGNENAENILKAATSEVIEISKALNINLDQNDYIKFIDVLNKLAKDGKTSMLQDIEAKRKTEVEMFSGEIVRLGKIYNIKTPVNEMLFNLIKAIEFINEKSLL